jgi:peptide/nickel transport system permease protein
MPAEPEAPAPAAGTATSGPPRPRGWLSESLVTLFRVMWANPLTFAGFLVVVALALGAVVVAGVPFFTGLLGHAYSVLPYTPYALGSDLSSPPSSTHWFGTDRFGTDIFTLTLAALPLDLAISLSIAGISVVAGGALGLVAGYYDRPGTLGGVGATIVLRVTDIFLAFPSLVLALAVAAALGHGTTSAIIAILVTWWPYYVRLARGEVLSIRDQPYITAARAAGVSDVRILGRHILRNIAEPLVVYFTLDVGTVLVVFSTISFVGVGVPYGVPEWGNIVQHYANLDFPVNPWDVAFPGLAIFVTVLAFSLLGDGLRDILDPRSRRILAQPAARVEPPVAATGSTDA